ncbi:MAG: rane protein [Actinomycetota bacterium]|nr:rane protein [Actinomycetota bacterium]
MNRLRPLLERLRTGRARRAWQRYGDVRGTVLAGGVAYFALFSLFPALALGFTVLGTVMGGRADLQQRVADSLNATFGTTVIAVRPGEEGIWRIDEIVRPDLLTGVGLIGFVVLLFAGLGWIGALRDGVSAVFGVRHGPGPVASKVTDLGILVVFGLSVLCSAVGSILVTAATGPVLDWMGLGRTPLTGVTISVLTTLGLFVIDIMLFLVLFRVLSGVRPDLDDVLGGALAGAGGLGLLKLGGGVLLGFVSGNRVVATFGVLVGLLIWMNLAARLTLLAAAWAATTMHDRGRLELTVVEAGTETPVGRPPTCSAPEPTYSAPEPTYSARAADRTTLLAGAVLGATAAVGARAFAGLRPSSVRGSSRSSRS